MSIVCGIIVTSVKAILEIHFANIALLKFYEEDYMKMKSVPINKAAELSDNASPSVRQAFDS